MDAETLYQTMSLYGYSENDIVDAVDSGYDMQDAIDNGDF